MNKITQKVIALELNDTDMEKITSSYFWAVA